VQNGHNEACLLPLYERGVRVNVVNSLMAGGKEEGRVLYIPLV